LNCTGFCPERGGSLFLERFFVVEIRLEIVIFGRKTDKFGANKEINEKN
jgi:hypothetical protein